MKKQNIKHPKSSKTSKTSYIALGISMLLLVIMFFIAMTFYIRQKAIFDYDRKQNDASGRYRYHFAMIADEGSESFWNAVYEGALEKALENDAYVESFGSRLNVDYTKAELLDIAIAADVDGILLAADGSEEMTALIEKATEARIPVVTLLHDMVDSSRVSYVGVSYYNLGQQYAQQIIRLIEKKTKEQVGETDVTDHWNVRVLLDSSVNESVRNMVYATIQESVSNKKDISSRVKLDAYTIDSNNSFEAEEIIRNMFLYEEEDLPDIVVCLDEATSACVYQVLVDYNKVGNIEMIGYYTGDIILSGIKKNIVFSTSGVDTENMGVAGVDALIEYITTGYTSDYYSVDTYIVDTLNVDEYLGGNADE